MIKKRGNGECRSEDVFKCSKMPRRKCIPIVEFQEQMTEVITVIHIIITLRYLGSSKRCHISNTFIAVNGPVYVYSLLSSVIALEMVQVCRANKMPCNAVSLRYSGEKSCPQ